MGIYKKRDGRYVVGKGIVDSNEYKGSAGWRDMVIQYTASGATEKSLEYLEYLRDYALYHSGKGEPIIPPNVSIWLSTEDTMKAVEADDISVSGETVSIGAVTWDGSDWTFGTPSSGGGGGSSLPSYTSSDIGKVLTVGEGSETIDTVIVPEQTVTLVGDSQDPVPLNNAEVFVDLAVGTVCTLSVNGDVYEVEVEEDDGVKYVNYDNYTYTISYAPDGPYAGVTFSASAGTYAVGLSAPMPSSEAKWGSSCTDSTSGTDTLMDSQESVTLSNYIGTLDNAVVPIGTMHTEEKFNIIVNGVSYVLSQTTEQAEIGYVYASADMSVAVFLARKTEAGGAARVLWNIGYYIGAETDTITVSGFTLSYTDYSLNDEHLPSALFSNTDFLSALTTFIQSQNG